MRRVLSASIVGVVIPFAVAACEDASEPGEIRDDPAMSAYVDGTLWEGNYQIERFIGEYTTAEGELEITGLQRESQTSTRQITLVIDEFAGVGTYTIGGGEAPAGAYYVHTDQGVTQFYGSGPEHTGSVSVDTMDTENRWITGTFHFNAVGDSGEVEVTEGRFRGRYVFGSPE